MDSTFERRFAVKVTKMTTEPKCYCDSCHRTGCKGYMVKSTTSCWLLCPDCFDLFYGLEKLEAKELFDVGEAVWEFKAVEDAAAKIAQDLADTIDDEMVTLVSRE